MPESFQLEYGSGNASGNMMRETLGLGGSLTLTNVRMGRVNITSKRLQRFQADGIVGLGLEALSMITRPSLFTSAKTEDKALLARFSVYVNPLPGYLPSSQLILGGADDSLVSGNAEVEGANAAAVQWQHFPVIPYPDKSSHGFWSIRMHDLAVLASVDVLHQNYKTDPTARVRIRNHDLKPEEAGVVRVVVSRGAVAIVDSGTSVLLFPTRIFNETMAMIQRHLRLNHAVEMRVNEFAISGFACSECAPEMFPSLVFAFRIGGSSDGKAKTLVLQGLDYVRCDGDLCMPQIDMHSLFASPSSTGDVDKKSGQHVEEEDVIVLGAIFLRAYYALFDVQARRVGFACADQGQCQGGLNPKLQFHADFISDRRSFTALFWTRLYFSTGVVMLFFAGALLWMMVTAAKDGTDGDDKMVVQQVVKLNKSPSDAELGVLLQDSGESADESGGLQHGGAAAANRFVSLRKSICFEV